MVFIDFFDGYSRIVLEETDQMGFNGMAEIYLCLYEQYPQLSR